MDKKGYQVTLSEEEKLILERIISEGKLANKTITRARILLACDAKGRTQGVTLSKIAEDLGIPRTTVQNVRLDFKNGGFEHALYNKGQHSEDSVVQKRINGLVANVKELIKEEPPEGRDKWSVRLLCSECEKRGYADHVAVGKMFRLLKKYNVTL